jgi:hypothetical protein
LLQKILRASGQVRGAFFLIGAGRYASGNERAAITSGWLESAAVSIVACDQTLNQRDVPE